jgi:hypothetical protein
MLNLAPPILISAAASNHGAAFPSLELLEARQLRDALKILLRREQSAMADFLVALSDFDRRRGWEALGHASLFSFLHVDLGLSKSAAYYRRSAAGLLQDFPEVIGPLRDGKLCLSSIGELAKVLTRENHAVVTPRFFGLSAREAQELVAELQPRAVPSTRMVVTRVLDQLAPVARTACVPAPQLALASTPPPGPHPDVVPLSRFPTSGIADGGGAVEAGLAGQTRLPGARRDEIVPLSAEVRRLHFNVGTQVVRKLEAARDGLSHAIPGASMEQVLEAALDLLLEKQARARGLVKQPRTKLPEPALAAPSSANAEPLHRREGPREAIPAAVRRAVWERDGGRCSWPLDGGGCCGSTHRLELDHVVPWARGGESTPSNLRVTCAAHNRHAARHAFGTRCIERCAGKRSG